MTLNQPTCRGLIGSLMLFLVASTGCTAFMAPRETYPITPPAIKANPDLATPTELNKVTAPPYVIEPPDVLLINAVKIVPRPPHKIEPFDGLLVSVIGVPPEAPIQNAFSVDPEGNINLGPTYGSVRVVGLTVPLAQEAIRAFLSPIYRDIEVSVSLAFSAGAQQIQGEHLVGQDGKVNLGTYGSVYVTGLTIEEAKAEIEAKLSEYLEDPKVIVDVLAYNSKKFYVITQGGGFGDNMVQLPITGNETVMDALTQIGGLSQLSSTKIWIARPAPDGQSCAQILPVNYQDITMNAITATNYQIFHGDRLFIAEDRLTRFDNFVGKVTRPFERMFGFTALGTNTLNGIERFGLGNLN
jgi:polysaccharide export outer membrane protein